MSSFPWPHKDLLDTADLTREEILHILDTAHQFAEINTRPVKKVPTLRGKSVVLFFVENSTRTKTSFDVAGKRLSADTFSLAKSGSSIGKGESLKDTILTLEAMAPDMIVIRHSASGAARFIAERSSCSIVNAGDGWHAHPTQALLDAYTLQQQWDNDFSNKRIAIIGDVAHSRVARSNIHLLHKFGVEVNVFAPKTLLPAGIEHWPVNIHSTLEKAVEGVDAIMGLRLQLERQEAGLLPDLAEYAAKFCITQRHLDMAAPGAPLLHPGPINRGLDVSAEIADSPNSLILNQVAAGVAVRMAILFILGTRQDSVNFASAEE